MTNGNSAKKHWRTKMALKDVKNAVENEYRNREYTIKKEGDLFKVIIPQNKIQFGYAEWRNGKGQLHCEDGPAKVDIDSTGNEREYGQHWLNGVKIMQQFNDGYEYYDADGELHRENGPAKVDKHGEYFYRHGELHRENGPAVTEWETKINYATHSYYLFDEEFDEEEYCNKLVELGLVETPSI